MKLIYGPVPSWRLGKSLGVDPISSEAKTCSFDCAYCQLGKTKNLITEKKTYIDPKKLRKELKKILNTNVAIDIITLSGTGEPTLALNLEEIIQTIKDLSDLPIAILTNSTHFGEKKTKSALSQVDKVIAKLDAWDEKSLKEINHPHPSITFEKLWQGIKNFKSGYTHTFCLQMMFAKEFKSNTAKLAQLAHELKPDEVQINTPLRPCKISPLSKSELKTIKNRFHGLNAYTVYEKERPTVQIVDINATLKRRPKL